MKAKRKSDERGKRTPHQLVSKVISPIAAFPLSGGRSGTCYASGLPFITMSPHSSIDIKPPAVSALF
jgi:hypothetical protein